MIDLDVIDAKCNEYLNSIGRSCGTILDVNEIKVLVECARKAEKDAARYRWLRKSASTEDHGGLAYNFRLVDAIRYIHGAAPNETMDIDSAIDKAMQCNK